MADGGGLETRVVRVEQKLDALEASVEMRFADVHRRFDDVDAAILEQRRYTEFAYERLDAKMEAGFSRLEAKIDSGLGRLDGVEGKLHGVEARIAKMNAGFARVERKLDQFIDSQSRTNDLAERRLRRLERARPKRG